jgi:hypothetical protein
MRLTRHVRRIAILAAIASLGANVEWSPVAPGISYREYTLDGPVRVFAARADRGTTNWTVDSMTSLGTIKGGRETVPDMAARYQDSVTFDGRRYDVKVAINGDYFDMKTGVAAGGQIISGWFVKRFGEYAGGSGFVWTTDRRCFLGGDVQNAAQFQRVIFADKTEMRIDKLNEPRGKEELALYTPQFAESTGTDNDGVEVLVRVAEPVRIMPKAPGVKGQIVQVREKAGSTPLLFDHVVLSASGQVAGKLLKHAKAGQDLHIILELKDYGITDAGLPPADWSNAYASIGGPKCVLINSKVPHEWWENKAKKLAEQGKKHGSVIKDPRTAIAFDDRYLYFLVIDGRSQASIGMTFTEVGNFCRDELKARNAILQDGGGSSTLWVDGKVRNMPSGKVGTDPAGGLRPVANGYLIALVLPPKRSDAFRAGQKATLRDGGQLRLGPGVTYASARKLAAGQSVTVKKHELNGIFAKGAYWWCCEVEDQEGWTTLEQPSKK